MGNPKVFELHHETVEILLPEFVCRRNHILFLIAEFGFGIAKLGIADSRY